MGGEGFLRQCDINRGFCNRPALLLGRQAVALVLRTLGVLAGLAVAVQAVLVHPIAREVLRRLDLATRPAVLQDIEWQTRLMMFSGIGYCSVHPPNSPIGRPTTRHQS